MNAVLLTVLATLSGTSPYAGETARDASDPRISVDIVTIASAIEARRIRISTLPSVGPAAAYPSKSVARHGPGLDTAERRASVMACKRSRGPAERWTESRSPWS